MWHHNAIGSSTGGWTPRMNRKEEATELQQKIETKIRSMDLINAVYKTQRTQQVKISADGVD